MPPARMLPGALPAGPWRLPTSQEAPASNTARSKTADKSSCLLRSKKAEYERRDKEKDQDGAEGSGKKRGGQGGRPGKDNQQERPARGRDKKQEDDDHNEDDESGGQGFQKATEAMCVDGGASLHTSHRQLK